MNWVNAESQMMAEKIDEELLNCVFEQTIDSKIKFVCRLKGLGFGGVLEEWGVTVADSADSSYLNLGHDVPIVPHRHRLCYNKKRFRRQGPYVPLKFTDVILAHYPEEYIVTTHDRYYYLGERALTHNNIIVQQEYHDVIRGRVIFALIDCGQNSRSQKTVVRTEACGQVLLQNSSIDHMEMIRDDLLTQYKEILRLGC